MLHSPSIASSIVGCPRSVAGVGHNLNSPNTGWRNASFRGYPDHLASAEFAQGLDQLLELSGHMRTTMMCAEALWWRCHRALIADVLSVRRIEVVHILDAQHTTGHPYTSAARIVQGRLSHVPTEGNR